MKMRLLICVAAASVLPAAVWAQEPVQQRPDGAATQEWLALQTSNNASLGTARPMPGEVAEQVYSRYVKSFSHPIPEQFQRENFVSGGGGSGSGSGGQ